MSSQDHHNGDRTLAWCYENKDTRSTLSRLHPSPNTSHNEDILYHLLTTLLLLANPNTSLAGDQDFTVINKTGVEINALYVSPADKNDWGADILGKDTLADGASTEIEFDAEEEAEKWDLRIEDKEGNSIEWTDLDLTEISKVTLNFADGKATAKIE